MPLSRIAPVDMDQVRELLTETTSAMNTVRHLKSSLVDTKQLLQTYKDEGAIDGCFQVDTTRSDEYNYLLWSDSDEEVVLQVQGVLLEGHVPPVVGSGSENSLRLNDLVQSVLIGSHDDDNSTKSHRHTILRGLITWMLFSAATRLLTPTQRAKSDVVDHGAVDDNDVLRNVFRHGSHCYTEDNVVAFLKWDKKVDGSMLVTDMKPTMLHAGHIVDIGICFRMLKLNNRVRFLVRLDSVVVINRTGAEVLKDIDRRRNESQNVAVRPVKKARVHFKGSNIAVQVQTASGR
ncbi:hypothetical protein IW261DRAFT_1576180 [Armillaria novae-zelandiae]|uniref:Uncharacterized protein n=1 Tax=Armillaria novae-zelandiae TaxID=153914 RepID=A0AA39NBW5_9AGAR|nr:hypothetical protein IW261DRAFT_1576180 [Armillaria novae-zelandiae]